MLKGVLVSACVVASWTTVWAQTPPPGAPATGAAPTTAAPAWSVTAADTLRVESWSFFEPNPGGGNPDYAFAGNRLFLQARRTAPRLDLTFAVQHVGLLSLPERATGPGALGTGALYYAQGGERRNPQQLYLRYAHVRFKDVAPGLDLQAGRQAYASGAEVVSTNASLEALKRQRHDARLVGEFEWSLYQRAFDGLRVDWRASATHLTGVVFMPTQGGFARRSNPTMTGIVVGGAVLTVPRPRAELQGFVWHYRDDRPVTGRPDNTGLSAPRADLSMTTYGGSAIGVRPTGRGELDGLAWLALQTGEWYDTDHGAWSLALEGGHRWLRAAWSPWLRAGFYYASGDDDADDGSHGTFFPMLPTVRRFSQTTAYSTMNLTDQFLQIILRPRPALSLRIDLHRLGLASSADRWYAGSGATLSSGANFGYVSRPSHGGRRLGTSIETSAAWTIAPMWNVNGFVGHIAGGPVVTGSFAGDRLWFVYVENSLRWRRGS